MVYAFSSKASDFLAPRNPAGSSRLSAEQQAPRAAYSSPDKVFT